MKRTLCFAVCVLLTTTLARAQDWPQWRGAGRNGIAAKSPALLEEFPKDAPLKPLWVSADIPGGDGNGFGSVSVAGGKAYVYANLNRTPPWRMLAKAALTEQGYSPDMPPALSAAVEAARVSGARKELKDDPKKYDPWVADWIKANLKEDQKNWQSPAQIRLRQGASAVAIDVLSRVAPIADKKYDSADDARKALTDLGLDKAAADRALGLMNPREMVAEDHIYCLDAATGKTLWQKQLDGQWFYYPGSSTPTVHNGKVYIWNSAGKVYCLDAAKGDILWQSEPLGPSTQHHNRACSVMICDGLAVVVTDTGLAGLDAATGKPAFLEKKLLATSPQTSPATWYSGGKEYVLVNVEGKLALYDPREKTILWTTRCGGAATPTVMGDFAVTCGDPSEGLMAFKLSLEKATLLWACPFADTHAGPVVLDNHVYAVGGGYYEPGKGKAICVELPTPGIRKEPASAPVEEPKDTPVKEPKGRPLKEPVWTAPLPNAQLSSPLLADGKIIAVSGTELVVFNASPEKFTLVGKAELGLLKWCSPAIADGKVFLRTPKNVICVDLTKK